MILPCTSSNSLVFWSSAPFLLLIGLFKLVVFVSVFVFVFVSVFVSVFVFVIWDHQFREIRWDQMRYQMKSDEISDEITCSETSAPVWSGSSPVSSSPHKFWAEIFLSWSWSCWWRWRWDEDDEEILMITIVLMMMMMMVDLSWFDLPGKDFELRCGPLSLCPWHW